LRTTVKLTAHEQSYCICLISLILISGGC